jgi:hypothetical protein
MKTRNLISIAFLSSVLLALSGCQLAGVILSPGTGDAKVTPDFDLEAANKDAPQPIRLAVIVDQASYVRSELNLRYILTNAIKALAIKNLKFDPEQIVDYKEIAVLRNSETEFSTLSPVEIGKRLNCDYVILASIVSYDLYLLPEKGYYAGTARTVYSLHGVKEGKRLMPLETAGRSAEIEVELEKGLQQSVSRICSSTAYCIVRDLYPVALREYNIMDEKKKLDWE